MPEQPLKKVTGSGWWNGKRYAVLECRHRVDVSPKDAMPYEIACPKCPPEPEPA